MGVVLVTMNFFLGIEIVKNYVIVVVYPYLNIYLFTFHDIIYLKMCVYVM